MEATFSERLARLIEEIHYDDLPVEVVRMAKACFLDWLGCAYAARDEGAVKRVAEVARISKGKGQSTVVPYGEKNSASFSALVNGAAAHALEMDDVHRDSVLHPASVVISAVYAAGERERVSGKSLIEAIVTGYEIMIRTGEGVGRSHYWFWHNTSTCGTFGAAAGVGKLLGLTTDQHVHALGNAGSQSGGLWEFLADGANTKLLHTGKAAMNGILAADLAKRNFTGARKIFEGERGFYRATSKDYSLDKLIEGIDDRPSRYRILSDSFKPYPSCRHTHSVIDAALDLAVKKKVPWQEVEKVIDHTYSGAINLCGGVTLVNTYAAKWNIPFCVATALKYRRVSLESFTESRLREEALLELAEKVQLQLDPELDALYPAQWPSRLEIHLKGGDRISTAVYTPKGDPDNPISKVELETKFRDNATVSLHPDTVETLIEAIDHLEERKDVGTLLRRVPLKE